jgi:hypothetical protein
VREIIFVRRKSSLFAAVALALLGMAGLASTASATYHENYIREVHEGSGGAGAYVELQAYASGQNFVSGKHIVSYDGGGAVLSNFAFPTNVSNGADQATILLSNGGVSGADFTATPGSGNDGTHLDVDNTGGTICYTDSSITVGLDCVAFQGTMNPVTLPAGAAFGAPFALPGLNLDNQTLVRTISRGCATALDTADDTNSAADFSLGMGNPRGNPVTPTEMPCPAPPANKKKCKKKHKKTGGYSAKKHKKCKKHKKKTGGYSAKKHKK